MEEDTERVCGFGDKSTTSLIPLDYSLQQSGSALWLFLLVAPHRLLKVVNLEPGIDEFCQFKKENLTVAEQKALTMEPGYSALKAPCIRTISVEFLDLCRSRHLTGVAILWKT